jgi:Gpi18-like mannosyltransferase
MRHCLSNIKSNLFGEYFGISHGMEEDQFFIQFGDPLLYWYFRDKMPVSKALLLTQKKTKYIHDADAVQLLKESNFQLFEL